MFLSLKKVTDMNQNIKDLFYSTFVIGDFFFQKFYFVKNNTESK